MEIENCDVIDRVVNIPLLAEDAHADCEMEWWFFQGRYQSGFAEKSFMVGIFRQKLEEDEGDDAYGFQLMLTLLDSKNATEHHTETWADQRWISNYRARIEANDYPLDDAVVSSFLEETKNGKALRYNSLKEPPTRFESSPLNIEWDHFSLKQEVDQFVLQFIELGSGKPISLYLKPLVPLFNVDCLRDDLQLGRGLAYHTIPRMEGGGMRGKQSLVANAWMDHQWGSVDWLYDREQDVMLSWDWFGINLENGSDWLVMVHRNIQTSEPVFIHATMRDSNGVVRKSGNVTLTQLKHWESPRTHIIHPIEWKIEIPELAAEFNFTPSFEDQEVHFPDASRAIWEGAGTVSGTVEGVPVTGHARGEFTGNGYILDFQEGLKQWGARVDRSLEKFIPRQVDLKSVEGFVGPATWLHEPEAFQKTISEPVWDLIDRSGKRWRPVFGMLLLESMGVLSGPWEDLIAAMTELIHTGALMVDDVEDDSALRRGDECSHLKYGVDVALNAANTLYFLPAVALFKHPLLTAEKRARLHEIKEYTCIEAHCGQATDIYWSRELSISNLNEWLENGLEDKIRQMYAYKTGAGVVGLAKFTAVIADVEDKVYDASVEFSRAFAVSFQIVDDVLNFSRSEKWSKTCGEDLANGKPTYVIVRALNLLPSDDRDCLIEILCDSKLRHDPTSLEQGIELIYKSGALEACRDEAKTLTKDAWSLFSDCLEPSEPKILLNAMCQKLLDLAFDN